MTTIDKIWEYIDANEPFFIHLIDGRKFFIKDLHWISTHPSRQSAAITVYGPGEEEEHFVPVFAISSLTRNDIYEPPPK
jgi:hypothetical protein